ncbi:MAG: S1 family peptidase [Rhizobiaceae bacterium]
MLQNAEKVPKTTIALLEHISGPAQGTRIFLSREFVDIFVVADRSLRVASSNKQSPDPPPEDAIVRLESSDGTYNLQAIGDTAVWINGRLVTSAQLVHQDIIEFGEKGPLSRFRLMDSSAHSRRHFSEIYADCRDYLQTSRKPLVLRIVHAIFDGLKRLVTETTILYRAAVIATLALLIYVTIQQYRLNEMQQEQLASGDIQLQTFARQLSQSQDEAITPADMERIRVEMSQGLAVQQNRLESLEDLSHATERVISETAGSVIFLLGSYGFREKSTGKPLRYVLGPMGKPLAGPNGQPLLTTEGGGQTAERQFTGTGFAVGDGTILATNRHVAVPWGEDTVASKVASAEREPFMIRFQAYAPGRNEPENVELLQASDSNDLALLRLTSPQSPLSPLDISRQSVTQGEQVIVMGYPTGLRSMIVRTGEDFLEELQASKTTDFWKVAELLAERDLIQPLSSSGIVAQISSNFLVYDAATTKGGSGGPVLSSTGEIVAVNAAILPGYDGSNLGIPADHLLRLMEEAGISGKLVAN